MLLLEADQQLMHLGLGQGAKRAELFVWQGLSPSAPNEAPGDFSPLAKQYVDD